MKTNEQKLQEAYNEFNPSNLDLVFGCEVSLLKPTWTIYADLGGTVLMNLGGGTFCQDKIWIKESDEARVLGKPLTTLGVLEMLRGDKKHRYYIRDTGDLCIAGYTITFKDLLLLDLSKPLVRDQSEEVQAQLVELLDL